MGKHWILLSGSSAVRGYWGGGSARHWWAAAAPSGDRSCCRGWSAPNRRSAISIARVAAASRRSAPNGRTSRTMPRQARKPCSGWGRRSRISSQSAAVAGPIEAASRRMRSTVQSAYRRWLDGMCSGTVVCRWLLLARASHPRPHRPALVGRHVILLHPAAHSGAEVQHRLLTYRIIKEICNAARELARFPAPFFRVLPDLFVLAEEMASGINGAASDHSAERPSFTARATTAVTQALIDLLLIPVDGNDI